MKYYELILLIRYNLSSQDVHKIGMYYKNFIEEKGGIILKKEYWGLRNLAYSVKKNRKAHYLYMVINSEYLIIEKVRENLNVSEDIIKYLIIRTKNYSRTPSLMIQPSSNLNKYQTW